MPTLVEAVDLELSILTVIGQLIILLVVLALVNDWKKLKKKIYENSILMSFIVALVATLGSLFYSEVAGFVPCKLCWFQRIFMYPQVFLLGVALWKKDVGIKIHAIVLSIIGGLLAGYHYLLQRGIFEATCDVVGYSEGCASVFTMTFGYITIPLMALTAFVMIILFMAVPRGKEGEKK